MTRWNKLPVIVGQYSRVFKVPIDHVCLTGPCIPIGSHILYRTIRMIIINFTMKCKRIIYRILSLECHKYLTILKHGTCCTLFNYNCTLYMVDGLQNCFVLLDLLMQFYKNFVLSWHKYKDVNCWLSLSYRLKET